MGNLAYLYVSYFSFIFSPLVGGGKAVALCLKIKFKCATWKSSIFIQKLSKKIYQAANTGNLVYIFILFYLYFASCSCRVCEGGGTSIER